MKNLEQVQIKWNFNNGRQLVKQLKLDDLLDHKQILLSDWGLLNFDFTTSTHVIAVVFVNP